mmetsp:Transcript_19253/g.27105  ORF Transcript_19253/g.27105 Transcript_19253/m.27105 type:complete len:113 (-) Transcript_19253:1401-1739(-)
MTTWRAQEGVRSRKINISSYGEVNVHYHMMTTSIAVIMGRIDQGKSVKDPDGDHCHDEAETAKIAFRTVAGTSTTVTKEPPHHKGSHLLLGEKGRVMCFQGNQHIVGNEQPL